MTYEQRVQEVTGESLEDAKVTVELMRDATDNRVLDHLGPTSFRQLAAEASEDRELLKATDPEVYAFYVRSAR
jgi:hypothetical protein